MKRNTFLSGMTFNNARTENAMPAHSHSDSALLDLYFNLGTRNLDTASLKKLWVPAYEEDPIAAIKILFYNRDVRGGRGERASFRFLLDHIGTNYLAKLVPLIPEYGRWDDLLGLLSQEAVREEVWKLITHGLTSGDRLCAKWMPRKGREARMLREAFEMSPKTWRKLIVTLSDTVEQKMCAKEWGVIDYNKLPSKAAIKYAKAFARNDLARYTAWKEALKKGDAKINVGTLYPHEIVHKILAYDTEYPVNEAWNKLLELFPAHSARMLPVCDVSGSMNGLPMEVSISLGIFLSQLNHGPFKDVFCTFSAEPRLQILKGDLKSRVSQLHCAQWDMNTDLEAVFKLILGAARNALVEDIPDTILILSDMQFDQCIEEPNDNAMQMITRMYAEAGIALPKVVFWNLRAVLGTLPVKAGHRGAALVSGFSPSILKTLVECGNLDNYTPENIMWESINVPRYAPIEEALKS